MGELPMGKERDEPRLYECVPVPRADLQRMAEALGNLSLESWAGWVYDLLHWYSQRPPVGPEEKP